MTNVFSCSCGTLCAAQTQPCIYNDLHRRTLWFLLSACVPRSRVCVCVYSINDHGVDRRAGPRLLPAGVWVV